MVRINAVLSEEIIELLDDIAESEKKSRSMLLREAAMKLIEEYKREQEKRRIKESRKHAIAVQDKLRKKSGRWNGVSEIRRWRENLR